MSPEPSAVRLKMAATADYDAPRRPVTEIDEDSLEELQARRGTSQSPVADLDAGEEVDGFALPGPEPLDEELSVAVVPILADEFRCAMCFLVHHRSQLVRRRDNTAVCRECA